MSAFFGLVRAELLQHRAGMLITPAAIALLIGVFFTSQLIFNTGGFDLTLGDVVVQVGDNTVLNQEAAERGGAAIAATFGFIAIPIFLVANVVSFFVMLSALYEERSERTILFFKSMPISDTQSVLAKYVTAAFIGPLIAIIVMMLLSAVLSLVSAAAFSMRGASEAWYYLGKLPLLKLFISYSGYYTLYSLWLAPIFAYLLMVSSLAPRSPFLCALLPVAIIAIAEIILLNSSRFLSEIYERITVTRLGEVLARSRGWEPDREQRTLENFFIRFSDFLTAGVFPTFWAGIVIAALFLCVAIWARGRKTL
ncbi:MAG: hypothetical protein AAF607_16715 [Pseudomonadota bacterium]